MNAYDDGVKAQEQGNFEEAEKHFERARKAAKRKKDPLAEALATRRLGFLAQLRADFVKAEKLYEKAVELFSSVAEEELCPTFQQFGMVAHKAGNLAVARQRYELSLSEAEKCGKSDQIAASQHLLGMVADDEGKLGRSQGVAREVAACTEGSGR